MTGRTCASPSCGNAVVNEPGRRGRPPIYCSPSCRPSHKGTANNVHVDIDQDGDDDAGGRFWTVTLRRGARRVVVGRDLGRISATVLAGELWTVLHPRRRQEGDAIE
jgi:hypothetical protein